MCGNSAKTNGLGGGNIAYAEAIESTQSVFLYESSGRNQESSYEDEHHCSRDGGVLCRCRRGEESQAMAESVRSVDGGYDFPNTFFHRNWQLDKRFVSGFEQSRP